MKKFVLSLVFFGLSACDSGTWADAPALTALGGSCTDKDADEINQEIKKDDPKARGALFAVAQVCTQRQMNFAKEVRCKDKAIQVKCVK